MVLTYSHIRGTTWHHTLHIYWAISGKSKSCRAGRFPQLNWINGHKPWLQVWDAIDPSEQQDARREGIASDMAVFWDERGWD